MIIDKTINGDLNFADKNYKKLKHGLVIFPETIEEAKTIKILKKFLKSTQKKMTYEQAQQKALTVEWKTTLCDQGKKCWCRIIEPVEPIIYDEDEEYYIVGSGSIPQAEAEHLVELHNNSL